MSDSKMSVLLRGLSRMDFLDISFLVRKPDQESCWDTTVGGLYVPHAGGDNGGTWRYPRFETLRLVATLVGWRSTSFRMASTGTITE